MEDKKTSRGQPKKKQFLVKTCAIPTAPIGFKKMKKYEEKSIKKGINMEFFFSFLKKRQSRKDLSVDISNHSQEVRKKVRPIFDKIKKEIKSYII